MEPFTYENRVVRIFSRGRKWSWSIRELEGSRLTTVAMTQFDTAADARADALSEINESVMNRTIAGLADSPDPPAARRGEP